MDFVVSWKYSDDSFEINTKYFGDSYTFLWPSIGEYVEVENPKSEKRYLWRSHWHCKKIFYER